MNKTKQLQWSNNELSKKLTLENQEIMTNIVVYIRVSKISDDRIELIRQDLLEMALGAQERDVSLSEVFGEDYKLFCDEIIANVKPERFKKFAKGLPYLLSTFALFGILNFVSSQYFRQFMHDIRVHSTIKSDYPVTLGFIVNTVFIFAVASVIVQVIGKFSFKTDEFLDKFHRASSMMKFLIGGVLGLAAFLYLFGIYTWHGYVVFYVNVWAYLAIIVPLSTMWAYFFVFPKSFRSKR